MNYKQSTRRKIMGWLKQDENANQKNSFACFASDLESFQKHSGRDCRCPLCRDKLTKKVLWANPRAVGDEPYAMFTSVCPHCEARLTIFND
jgi:hypothetical protein